jgi:hypothetical protein
MKWLPAESMPDIIVNNVFLIPKVVVSLIVGFGWNYNMQRIFVYKELDYRKYFTDKRVPESAEEGKNIEKEKEIAYGRQKENIDGCD